MNRQDTFVSITFVLTTYNKLPWLEICLSRLIASLRDDEEIIVVDAGSIDGTSNYLKTLYQQGKINAYLSESDYGQGHGINKAILMSSGRLIKLINDDDWYNFEVIYQARLFMLENPSVDALFSDAYVMAWRPNPHLLGVRFNPVQFSPSRDSPFITGDLGLMLRRSSLPLTGLFAPSLVWTDYEFAMRLTASSAKLVYMKAVAAIRLTNPKSKSVRFEQQLNAEKLRINSLYIEPWHPTSLGDRLRVIKKLIFDQLSLTPYKQPDKMAINAAEDDMTPSPKHAYSIADNLLSTLEDDTPYQFFVSTRSNKGLIY